MKGILSHVDDRLHAAFKKATKSGAYPYTMAELAELGVILVLAERGLVTTREDALRMGANDRMAVVFENITQGKAW